MYIPLCGVSVTHQKQDPPCDNDDFKVPWQWKVVALVKFDIYKKITRILGLTSCVTSLAFFLGMPSNQKSGQMQLRVCMEIRIEFASPKCQLVTVSPILSRIH